MLSTVIRNLSTRRRGALLAVGVTALAATLGAGLGRTDFLETIEAKSYDWRARHLLRPAPAGPSVLVLIDEGTLRVFKDPPYGVRWPFPRELYCPVLRYLKHAGAAAVAFDIQFSEPDMEFDPAFADCLRANGRAWLAYQCQGDHGGDDRPWPVRTQGTPPLPIRRCPGVLPMPELAAAAHSGARIDFDPDPDGVIRWARVLQPSRPGEALPQLGVAPLFDDVSATALFTPGQLHIGRHVLPLDDRGRVLVRWRPPEQPWPTHSFASVYENGLRLDEGKSVTLDPARFRGKTVFIGASAAATYEFRVTPIREADVGVTLHAAVHDAAVTGVAMLRAGAGLNLALLVLAALLVAGASLLIERIWLQMAAAGLVVVVYLGVAGWLFAAHGVWLDVVSPTLATLIALGGGTTIQYATEGRQKRRIRSAFQHYLAPAVIDQVVRDPSKLSLGGERRDITAFFSDIQGFTGISEKLDPTDLVALLNECLGGMTDLILESGGTIDKYIGDAIVAMYGAPLDQPDHAVRGCRAALRCQARLIELRRQWAARGKPELVVRIGLNSGSALVGNMGSAARFDYTMMGDTVNLASRLEGANAVYGTFILVGEEVVKRAEAEVLFRELDALRVKGKSLPVRVFHVLAMKAEATPALVAVADGFARGLAAYRGQQWEVARAAFEALADDPPAKVFLGRIAAFEKSPPGGGWDGVYEMTTK
ncbi:MAG: adenylate/guanylate cyclase domain-containing protein [Myxococcales bacterium]|nr:adenylate/guanylate cyclase domain-containing protein [Myxococcales bacterium]